MRFFPRKKSIFGGILAALVALAVALGSMSAGADASGDGAHPLPKASGSKVADDYANAPKMQALRHWDHMPVRLYFAPESSSKERMREALAGISEWSIASGGVLWYAVVTKEADADVTIRFVDTSTVPSGGTVRIGETQTESYKSVMHKAWIRIAVGDATADQVSEDAAHEYGHALGIAGHSDDPHDLMYPTTTRYYMNGVMEDRPSKTVTARDLNTVRRAYPELFVTTNHS